MKSKQLQYNELMTTSVEPNHTSSTTWVRLIAAPTVEALDLGMIRTKIDSV